MKYTTALLSLIAGIVVLTVNSDTAITVIGLYLIVVGLLSLARQK